MRSKRATSAPGVPKFPSRTEVSAKLGNMLQDQFSLSMLYPFTLIVEGTTDRDYLFHAAAVAYRASGQDLLEVPVNLRAGGADRMLICTPGQPGVHYRGGTPQMIRLARELAPFVFTLEMFTGIVFLFDHDDEGIRASNDVRKYGYVDSSVLTLDPKEHPGACSDKQVVVEDLLTLDIQTRYFERGEAWCSVDYQAGRLVRYRWRHQSKSGLRDYVKNSANEADIAEMIAVLQRVRAAFGFID